MFFQKSITLKRPRGYHLITDLIIDKQLLDKVGGLKAGLLNVFVRHTSCSLTINENCDPDVRSDMETIMNRVVPEDPTYLHLDEGMDDMTGHAKSSLMGCSLTIPVGDGKVLLGTWQGIWFNEHRDHGGNRSIVITLHGE